MVDRSTNHGWGASNLSPHLVCNPSSILLSKISDFSGLMVCSGVEQKVPAWRMLQWADIALLGLGRCSQVTVFFEGRLFSRFLLMGIWSLQSPCRGLMHLWCASLLAAPWMILENWAAHLPPFLVETLSLLQDTTLEGPKVPGFRVNHTWPTLRVNCSRIFCHESLLLGPLSDHLSLSSALPFKELANQLLGMIACLLQ